MGLDVKKRNCSIDIFRYFCAILVVIIHTNPLSDINPDLGYAVSQIMTRIGVPFFFTVAGYFYTQKLEKNQKIFIPYVKKLFLTYFIWSCVYLLYEFSQWGYSQIKGFIVTGMLNFFIKGSYYHFWFFPALIISVGIVTLFYKLHLKKLLLPLAIIMYSIGCFGCSYYTLGIKIPVLGTLYSFSEFTVIRRIFFMGLPFFICGYIINIIKDKFTNIGNKNLIFALAGSIILWLAEIVAVIRLQWQTNIIITFGLYLLVITVMLFLLNNPLSGYSKLADKCRILANFTYYSHPFIMILIKNTGLANPKIVLFILTVIVSALIGLLLSKFSNRKIIRLITG